MASALGSGGHKARSTAQSVNPKGRGVVHPRPLAAVVRTNLVRKIAQFGLIYDSLSRFGCHANHKGATEQVLSGDSSLGGRGKGSGVIKCRNSHHFFTLTQPPPSRGRSSLTLPSGERSNRGTFRMYTSCLYELHGWLPLWVPGELSKNWHSPCTEDPAKLT